MSTAIQPSSIPFISYYVRASEKAISNAYKRCLEKVSAVCYQNKIASNEDYALSDSRFIVLTFATKTAFSLLHLANSVSSIAISLLSLPIDFVRWAFLRKTTAHAVLSNVPVIPYQVFVSLVSLIFNTGFLLEKSLSTASGFTGLLVWHTGEKAALGFKSLLVKSHTEQARSVLSKNVYYRHIVYKSLGITLLAAAGVFVSIPLIQFASLPIIFGSLYGILNNQFTVRKCPQYYTMGHYFDGNRLEGHAIRTNNLLIKPIVTGCYATTAVTQVAGIILAAAATLPYTKATMSVAVAASVIAVSVGIALIAGHFFSRYKELQLNNGIKELFNLLDIELDEKIINLCWNHPQIHDRCLTQLAHMERQQHLAPTAELKAKLERIAQVKDSIIYQLDFYREVPLKFIPGWEANNMRNTFGYFFAGLGTVAVTGATVAIRILG